MCLTRVSLHHIFLYTFSTHICLSTQNKGPFCMFLSFTKYFVHFASYIQNYICEMHTYLYLLIWFIHFHCCVVPQCINNHTLKYILLNWFWSSVAVSVVCSLAFVWTILLSGYFTDFATMCTSWPNWGLLHCRQIHDIYLKKKLLDFRVSPFFPSLDVSKFLSKVVLPIYTLSGSQEYILFHILSNAFNWLTFTFVTT